MGQAHYSNIISLIECSDICNRIKDGKDGPWAVRDRITEQFVNLYGVTEATAMAAFQRR